MGRLRELLTDLAHVVGGFLTVLAVKIHPILTMVSSMLFVLYELDEEWHIRDEAYEDLREFLAGVYIAIVCLLMGVV